MTAAAVRVVEHNLVTFRHIWRTYLISVLTPVLFLLVLGLGVGGLIDGAGTVPGPYVAFLGPGLIVGAAAQTGALAGFGPIMGRIRWDPVYESMLHSPMRVGDVVLGELAWIALRLLAGATVFAAVLLTIEPTRTPRVLLCVVVAVATGLAFAAVFMVVAALAPNGYTYDVLSRVTIVPLFVLGDVFFPAERLPAAVRAVAELTPMPHGAALSRAALAGGPFDGAAALHLTVVLGYLVAATALAVACFRRRLLR